MKTLLEPANHIGFSVLQTAMDKIYDEMDWGQAGDSWDIAVDVDIGVKEHVWSEIEGAIRNELIIQLGISNREIE